MRAPLISPKKRRAAVVGILTLLGLTAIGVCILVTAYFGWTAGLCLTAAILALCGLIVALYKLLQLERETFHLIAEHSLDLIVCYQPDGTILYMSPACRHILGYEPEEMTGRPIANFVPPEEQRQVHRYFRLAANREMPDAHEITYPIYKKDGGIVWLEARRKILHATGKVQQIIAICRDITERKQAEESLHQQQERFRRLVDECPDAIVLSRDGVIQYVNDAAVRLFAASRREDLIGKTAYDLVHPDQHNLVKQRISALQAGHTTGLAEVRVVGLDGVERHVEIKTIPIPSLFDDTPGEHIIIRDISQQKQTEHLLRQSEKLSIAGQLAAGIAHEIRNPLTSLKGFLRLIQDGAGSKDTYFEIMQSELERIEVILSELLYLAKPKASSFQPLDLTRLVKDVVALLEAQAILHNTELKLTSLSQPVYVNGDANQLKQVFINLLKNGIEAMPHGGQLTIDLEPGQQEAVIRFTDQGAGIPPHIMERLGQPFASTKEKGTGLGLMVSFSIVQHHNGTIHVSSQEDKGTVFTVRLPLCDEAIAVDAFPRGS